MTDPPQEPATAIYIERLLPASIDEVFDAWTDPALMANWLSPIGHAEIEADLRVGGQFCVTMIGDDLRIEHTGVYLVIDPPRRLSFTWLSPYTGGHASRVDVTLTAHGATTLLVLSHQRLPDETTASHEGGWAAILDRLDALLGASVGATPAPMSNDAP